MPRADVDRKARDRAGLLAGARAALALTLIATSVHADVTELSGKVMWGQRAICEGSQGRKLIFAAGPRKTEATIDQGGHYSVPLEPDRYRVTLRCGGTDIKSVEVTTYPTPTHQDLTF